MPGEVLYTSEASGQLWNINVWDPLTGTSLCAYKGSSSGPRTLCLVGKDYIISAVNNKPVIHLWLLQKREQIHQRLVVSGRVSALTLSPDGIYCVGAVQELVHVWQISTGNLLAVLDKHYQCVTCIRFTDDGSHFVTAGADNLVLVWSFTRVVDTWESTNAAVDPRHVWSHHSLAVTDVCVGHGGVRSRVFTSSLDLTCKIYELCSGKLLMNLVFECPITSLIVDRAESRLFAGGVNGKIHQVQLYTSPVKTEQHLVEQSQPEAPIFTGHTKAVTCLTMSMDGTMLVSGSHDCHVKLWDVPSRQCIRSIQHKGTITNIMLSHIRPSLDHTGAKHLQPFQTFKRHLCGTEESKDNHGADTGAVSVLLNTQHDMDTSDSDSEDLDYFINKLTAEESHKGTDPENTKLQDEVDKLNTINRQIYDFAVNKIVSNQEKQQS